MSLTAEGVPTRAPLFSLPAVAGLMEKRLRMLLPPTDAGLALQRRPAMRGERRAGDGGAFALRTRIAWRRPRGGLRSLITSALLALFNFHNRQRSPAKNVGASSPTF